MIEPELLINQRLDEYKAKPIIPLELAQINSILADSDCSTDSFKHLYCDPIFCQTLVGAAWQATKNRTSHPFAADHAISLLGITGTKQLFRKISKEPQKLSIEVLFCLSSSVLAAELTRQIGQLSGTGPQAYWSSLFFHFPDTLLWHTQPQAMWRIYYRQLTIPKKLSLFEESKFGFNLQQWRKAVAETFHLGEQNQMLFNKPLPDSPKELFEYARKGLTNKTPSLKHWHKQEGWLVVLSNRLARSILAPWHSHSLRHEFDLIKQLTNCDRRQLQRSINLAIRVTSELLTNSTLICPAVSYLMQPGKPPYPDWLVKPKIDRSVITATAKKRVAATNRVKSAVTSANDTCKINYKLEPAKIALIINQLSKKKDSFESSSAFISFALKSLLCEFHFERVSFLVVDQKAKTASTKIALSADKCQKIRPDFQYNDASPLIAFIQKQAFLSFSKGKHQKIWRKLPAAIQQSEVEHFVLSSVKPGNVVRALIYLDAKQPEAFSAENVTLLKAVIKAISVGLGKINSQKDASLKKQEKA